MTHNLKMKKYPISCDVIRNLLTNCHDPVDRQAIRNTHELQDLLFATSFYGFKQDIRNKGIENLGINGTAFKIISKQDLGGGWKG